MDQLILDDFRLLFRFVTEVRDVLPDPTSYGAPQTWYRLMISQPETWHSLIDKLRYVGSCVDVVKASESLAAVVSTYACSDCNASFASNKALLCHCRKAHGFRDSVRLFLNADGVCPVCQTFFHSRLRVIAHVNDRRSKVCKPSFLSGQFAQNLPHNWMNANASVVKRHAARAIRTQ